MHPITEALLSIISKIKGQNCEEIVDTFLTKWEFCFNNLLNIFKWVLKIIKFLGNHGYLIFNSWIGLKVLETTLSCWVCLIGVHSSSKFNMEWSKPNKSPLKTTPTYQQDKNETNFPTDITINYKMVVLCCITMLFLITGGIFSSLFVNQGLPKVIYSELVSGSEFW